ncbi:transcriptional regulator [Moorella thermoacetica]|nr:PucR family transcriptional regulator ligand-binding domain-containing protein [Moorella thermoacetica]AKX95587.1 purine catabolism regulatory protein [Moorella thermoacetica]OIQ53702.1 purine catabolism regulatory protein [Moorella thermoacetica]QCZ99397.1 Purine catabolism regulatory protein [Moorella thermoacetica]TYL07738.1 Purine catabolism regulatory protein [Moorella thermoacetica]TYL07844.1 Purine catabolism regulatory protein [Moorella thermoacetica]
MGITVREALKLGGLRRAKVVAGEAGLERIIKYVDILEIPDPRGWFRANELIITTGYAIRNDPRAQANLLLELARTNGAGLAVKFGRFIGSVPEEMRRLADELKIPLLDVPDDIPYVEITNPLMAAIVNEQARQLEYSERVHRELTRVALEASNIQAVAAALATLVEREVVICDEELQPLAVSGAVSGKGSAGGSLQLPPEEIKRLHSAQKAVEITLWSRNVRRRYFVAPIDVREHRYGYILVDGQTPLSELNQIALEHAVTVTALQMVKEEAVVEARRSLQRDLLEDLIAGALRHRELAISRAEALGILLEEPKVIMAIDIDDFTGYLLHQPGAQEANAGVLKRRFHRAVNSCFMAFDRRVLTVQRSDSVVGILPANGREIRGAEDWRVLRGMLQELAASIQLKIARELDGVTVTIGISSIAADPMEISERYQEARTAIRLARRLNGKGTVAFWEDVELYHVLGQSGETLERFYRSVLGELDRPEVKNREELLETLRVYLECQGNVMASAAKLYIHRNTMRYRLQRIEELLGRDLDSPDERLALWLALKARGLIRSEQ